MRCIPRSPVSRCASSLLLVAGVMACGPKAEPEQEKVEILEHRVPSCTQWCGAKFECGNGANGEIAFDDEDGCVEYCASPTSNMVSFSYQGDGVDACIPEFEAMADCVDALSCEDQGRHFGVIDPQVLLVDRPCADTVTTMLQCNAEHATGG